ncbi:MAG: hypothetical protein WDM92_09740 [Caulobacteraceae bacterium]
MHEDPPADRCCSRARAAACRRPPPCAPRPGRTVSGRARLVRTNSIFTSRRASGITTTRAAAFLISTVVGAAEAAPAAEAIAAAATAAAIVNKRMTSLLP